MILYDEPARRFAFKKKVPNYFMVVKFDTATGIYESWLPGDKYKIIRKFPLDRPTILD